MLEKYFSKELQEIWKAEGVEKLNPHQKKALESGLLEGQNIVVSAPTASGKTLIAEFAAVNTVLERHKKVVYIVPLKALASEKYDEFKTKYEKFGIRSAISVGDLDSVDEWLGRSDIIIVTSEKMDSLLRHNAQWIKEIGLIIVDEIHLMNDPGRGPTLEIVITRLRDVTRAQILGLSATIRNCPELASWLNAKCIISDYRPVKLHEGVYDTKTLVFPTKGKFELENKFKPEETLSHDTVSKGKQALIFLSSRKNAEAVAENTGKVIGKILTPEEKQKLREISEEIYNTLDTPTKQCKRLAECIANGAAFHHAGLVAKQRKTIENAFKENTIKVLSSTPTLAIGVNLPAYRVIIRDMMRYSAGRGMDYLPVMEVKQMSGRAGRPKYDKEGEAILIAKNESEAEELLEKYVLGESEDVYSKLALEPVLRMHTLALVATGAVRSEEQLMEFFAKTFYAFQYGDTSQIEDKIMDILNMLVEHNFIVNIGGSLEPTRIGKRVAELYVDPETAIYIMNSLNMASRRKSSAYGYLFMVASTLEMSPGLRVSRTEEDEIASELLRNGPQLFDDVPNQWDMDYESFLSRFKTAMMVNAWINEMTDDVILKDFNVAPGELRSKMDIADWLLYASREIALLMNHKEIMNDIARLRVRIKNGIKEELLPLVQLRDVGRVRARRLWGAGLRSVDALRKADPQQIAQVVGPATAKSIVKQLSGKEEDIVIKKQTQKTLFVKKVDGQGK